MAKCPYFGTCGGCSLQHIPYELTLENKKKFVEDQLRKNGFSPETIELQHGKQYNYRNRMDFAFSSTGLSLREQKHFDRHVHIKTCDISNEKINLLMKEVQDWFDRNKDELEPFDIRRKEGVLKFALIRAPENTDESTICFAININSSRAAGHIEKIKEYAKLSSAKNIIIAKVEAQREDSTSSDFFVVKGNEMIEEDFLGKKLLYHSQGFFQNNTKVAELMVKKAREIFLKKLNEHSNLPSRHPEGGNPCRDASLSDDGARQICTVDNTTLLDLYGGVGTFGINLAELFSKTVILESVGPSIECAKLNTKKNHLANVEAHCCDASRMNKITNAKGNSLFVVTDPPRSGMEQKAIQNLLEMEPEVIIYVSCNPAQFAKEMKLFSKKYNLVSMTVFDMFPQTNHIETMTELRRRK